MTHASSSWCSGCVGSCAATRSYCPFTSAGRDRLAEKYGAKGERCPYWRASLPLAIRQTTA